MYQQTNAKISTLGTDSLICIIDALEYNHRLIDTDSKLQRNRLDKKLVKLRYLIP